MNLFSDSFTDELADKVAARVIAAIGRNGGGGARLLTLKEAAAYLSLSLSTLKLMIGDGTLRVVARGNRRMLDKADLDSWIVTHKK